MNHVLPNRLEQLYKHGTAAHLAGARRGIEKEGLRVDPAGTISVTPHPTELGAALTNRFITTDFFRVAFGAHLTGNRRPRCRARLSEDDPSARIRTSWRRNLMGIEHAVPHR